MFRILFACTLLATALPAIALEPIKGIIGFDGGYSRRTAPTADLAVPELESYVEKLRSGWSSGLTAAKFFGETYGLGVQFNMFSTSN